MLSFSETDLLVHIVEHVRFRTLRQTQRQAQERHKFHPQEPSRGVARLQRHNAVGHFFQYVCVCVCVVLGFHASRECHLHGELDLISDVLHNITFHSRMLAGF